MRADNANSVAAQPAPAGFIGCALLLSVISVSQWFIPPCVTAAPPASRPAAANPQKLPEPPQPGDAAIQTFLSKQAIELDRRFDEELPDPATWDDQRARWREQFLFMLGLSPMPQRSPLHAAVTGSLDREGFTVEKLHFQSLPHLYVTGNLYRPTRIDPGRKPPAVLYVCGHGYRGPEGVKAGYQSHGIWLARHGYVALLIDTLERGEIKGMHRGLYSEGRSWWLSRGYSPAAVECWNGIRAIDYLLTRPDVDGERIAVTGISGGGAYTMWIAAADERVKVAVPVSGMADLQAYVADQKTDVHCDCMFLHNACRWPWTRIAALIAPRPMLFVNSDQDRLFPLDANERVANRLERFYGRLGAGDLFDTVVSTGDHAYRQDIRQAVYRFLNTHLKGDPSIVRDSEQDLEEDRNDTSSFPIPPPMLRVFAEGALPADQLNTSIDERFVPAAASPPPAEGGFDSWRSDLLKALDRMRLSALTEPPPPAEPVGPPGSGRFTSEPGIELRLLTQNDMLPAAGRRLLLRVSLEDDAQSPTSSAWLKRVTRADDSIYFCQPRGVGETRWGRKAPPNRVERACALIGTTVDAGRVRDIAAAAAYLHRRYPESELVVTGQGPAGILAAYAALLEPAIQRIILVNPPTTHMDPAAPQFLNLLRAADVPDMLGLLAPRPLTLIDAPNPLQTRVRACYAAAGAGGQLEIVSNHP